MSDPGAANDRFPAGGADSRQPTRAWVLCLSLMAVLIALPLAARWGRPDHGAARPSLAPPSRPSAAVAAAPLRQELVDRIDAAAGYLARACGADGQFNYLVHLDAEIRPKPSYNMLRHAGAMYALAMYLQLRPAPEVKSALLRAGRFLQREGLDALPDRADLKAIWSRPEITQGDLPLQAKLGGAGLGLAALVSVERFEPGFTSREDLRGLARFILYLQKPTGEFYCKYYPHGGGRNDQWVSLYYPGEAALGLLTLYELEPDPRWLAGAAAALTYLARRGAAMEPPLIDHWMLLAMGCLLAHDDELLEPVPSSLLLGHVRRTCQAMIQQVDQRRLDVRLRGCLTGDGRSCPTATRLEGILAAATYLPQDDRLRSRLLDAARQGTQFLARCQVADGPLAGALTRSLQPDPWRSADADRQAIRGREVRIDYVQHALCAMIQYQRLCAVASSPLGGSSGPAPATTEHGAGAARQ